MTADFIFTRDEVRVERFPAPLVEKLEWNPVWKITKYANEEALQRGEPYEVVEIEGNITLNEGITRLLSLLIGGGGTAYDNANARIGVGDSTTAAAATQTDLQGANKFYKGMDEGYPQVDGQTVTFKATFESSDANFSWNELTIDNGAVAAENLNRKVSDQGRKVSGHLWEVKSVVTMAEKQVVEFDILASDDDAYIHVTGADYPPQDGFSFVTDGTFIVSERSLDPLAFHSYRNQVGLLRFDTSSLPDNALITAVKLRVGVVGLGDADGRSVTADYFDWYPADVSDYSEEAQTGAIDGIALSTLTDDALNDLPFDDPSFDNLSFDDFSSINKSGYTSIRLHISGGEPTGPNQISFASFDHATLPAPQLIVEYVVL